MWGEVVSPTGDLLSFFLSPLCLLTAPEDKGIWSVCVCVCTCPWPCKRHMGMCMCAHFVWRWGWQQAVSNHLSWLGAALCEAGPASGVAAVCT